jgi:hypothetical protein
MGFIPIGNLMNLDVLGDKAGFFHQRTGAMIVMKNQSTSMTSFRRAMMHEKPTGGPLNEEDSEYRDGLGMQSPERKRFIKDGSLRWAASGEKIRDRGGSVDYLN